MHDHLEVLMGRSRSDTHTTSDCVPLAKIHSFIVTHNCKGSWEM